MNPHTLTAAGPAVRVGGRSAPVPADWEAQKPANRLRSHQFRLPGADPAGAGELVVSPDADPDAGKVFARWAATVEPADGTASGRHLTKSRRERDGLTLHRLDAVGTWRYRDFPQAKAEERRPGWRVVWVVAVDADGATHLRLSGPAATVGRHLPAFDRWLDALE